jgi:hypothetical protein
LQIVETMYSDQELASMHFMYGFVGGNAIMAHHLYQGGYPE